MNLIFATLPDWNDVAEEDQETDGIIDHMGEANNMERAKVPVLWSALCPELYWISNSFVGLLFFLVFLLCVVNITYNI